VGGGTFRAVLVDPERFEDLVAEALDGIPEELGRLIDNVVVLVVDDPPEPDLLGRYDGVPLTERGDGYGGYGNLPLPDRIEIYRRPLCAMSRTEEEVVDQVRITVVHEVAHHFGIEDDRLDELGWG
jgi:predicted Zn-dependent protease with MMP-like domain